jgi:hypothetical protein
MPFDFDLSQPPVIFATTAGEALGTLFLMFCGVCFLLKEAVKRMDKGGAMKKAGTQAAKRGAWSLFNHLTKR